MSERRLFAAGTIPARRHTCEGCSVRASDVAEYWIMQDEGDSHEERVRYCPECADMARGGAEGAPWCGQPVYSMRPAQGPPVHDCGDYTVCTRRETFYSPAEYECSVCETNEYPRPEPEPED